ncbi:cytochrome P450 [Marasmius fiardii PR-910]|nr:cytochrome P450 [Marasmius fiardii PR-910]
MSLALSITASFLLFSTLFVLWFKRPSNYRYHYPPGPKPLPILGNVRDFTPKEFWLPVTKWAKKYGDVCYLRVLNWNMVFLNSVQSVDDLLDKRGAIYSDKPTLQMSGELCGVEKLMPFVKYDETLKRQRRRIQQTLGARMIPTYHPMIETATASLLCALVDSPAEYIGHIRKYAGGLTLSVVYGYRVTGNDDKFLVMVDECMSILANELTSGSGIWAVDVFPFLKYLPGWFPGCGFKKKAAIWKVKLTEFTDAPYAYAKAAVANGTIMPSLCSEMLGGEESLDELAEDEIKHSANGMFAGSPDPIVTTTSQFILAMLQYPETMRKAQEEIDRVVGTDRLPNFHDRESLPYVDALMSEVWRWGTPVPLNLPHGLTKDDIYNGMFIPKDTLVSSSAILRDEALFPNAETFDPERFLNIDPELKAKRDPRGYVFGFGRRYVRCPGADLVEASVWLLLVSILATLDITKSVDEEGRLVEPVVVYSNSFFRVPDNFQFDMKPRSSKALALLKSCMEGFGSVDGQ